MRGIHCAGVVLAAALAACSGQTAMSDRGTPSVHELARLGAAGQLDADRLNCLTGVLQSAVQPVPDQLRQLRQARANVESIAMADHSLSVQQGMLAGDAMNDAARQRASDLRLAASLESQGSLEAASSVRWHSVDLAARAEEMAMILVGAPASHGLQGLWSEADAHLLVEYAGLMAERQSETGDGSQASQRITDLQQSYPHVMEGYAALLLALYQAPDLECGPSV